MACQFFLEIFSPLAIKIVVIVIWFFFNVWEINDDYDD